MKVQEVICHVIAAESQPQPLQQNMLPGNSAGICRGRSQNCPRKSWRTHAGRERSLQQSKWVNGTVLHYCFFKSGHFSVPKTQADAVRGAFAKWKAIGIGLDFQEVSQLGDAEVRIGY